MATKKKLTTKDNEDLKKKPVPVEEKKEEKKKRRFFFFWFWLLRPENKTPLMATIASTASVIAFTAAVAVLPNEKPNSSGTSSEPSIVVPTFTVEFNPLGGSSVSSQTVEENTLLVEPTSIKEGFTLNGWYLSDNQGSSLTTEWNFETDFVTSSFVLYADWIVEQFTISFETNGGTDIDAVVGETGTIVPIPANPTKVGHTFVGWFSDEALTTATTIQTTIGQTSVTYYAMWSVNSYAITYIDAENISFKQIEAGTETTVALSTTGKLYAWGLNNFKFMQVGSASVFSSNTPVLIPIQLPEGQTIERFTVSGSGGVFLITNQNRLYAYGENSTGHLGLQDNVNPKPLSEVILPNLSSGDYVAHVSTSGSHSIFLTNGGKVYTVGSNSHGQLGNGTTEGVFVPYLVPLTLQGGEEVTKVFAGALSSFVLTNQSRMFAWGYNFDGRLGVGDGTNRNVPTLVLLPTLENQETITSVAIRNNHVGVLTSAKRVFLWGNNVNGELGQNSFEFYYYTPLVLDLSFLAAGDSVKFISFGAEYSILVTEAHRFYSVGSGQHGRTGKNSTSNTKVFGEITIDNYDGSDPLVLLSTGNAHAFFLTQSGKIYGWGQNIFGQIGDATNANKLTGAIVKVGTTTTLKTETLLFGTEIAEYTPTKENFTFGGWYKDEALTIPFTETLVPAQALTLYAKWIPAID